MTVGRPGKLEVNLPPISEKGRPGKLPTNLRAISEDRNERTRGLEALEFETQIQDLKILGQSLGDVSLSTNLYSSSQSRDDHKTAWKIA